jgi:hypothetical protein
MTFPSPTSSPSSNSSISPHIPAPSCSILLDDFPNRHPLLGMRSNTGSVYEASLWLPISSISGPIASATQTWDKSCEVLLRRMGASWSCWRSHTFRTVPTWGTYSLSKQWHPTMTV